MDEVGFETEQKAVLEVIKLTPLISVQRLPDLDGKPIYFPCFANESEVRSSLGEDRQKILNEIARSDIVVRQKLSEEQQERLSYTLNKLKLPVFLAVHAALNTDRDLESLTKPKENAPEPVTLAMLGRPGVGKSFITAMLSVDEGYPILSLDFRSGHSSEKYRDLIQNEAKRRGRNLSVEEAWDLIMGKRDDTDDGTEENTKTMRSVFDGLLDKVLSTKNRPAIYLCDMPGIPGVYNFGTGREHGKKRHHDVIDYMVWELCESGVINTHQLTIYTMNNKLRWIKEDIIKNNLDIWRGIREEFTWSTRMVKTKHVT